MTITTLDQLAELAKTIPPSDPLPTGEFNVEEHIVATLQTQAAILRTVKKVMETTK